MRRPTRGRGAVLGLVLLCLTAFAPPALAGELIIPFDSPGSPFSEVDLTPGSQPASSEDSFRQNGYRVMASPSLRVRSCPQTSCGQIGSLAVDTYIDIACQDNGENVGGSTVWDRLSSHYPGGWVADYWVYTGYNGFDPRLPRCSQPPASSREDRAVAWARSQLGQSHQPSGEPWNGWCGRFVANAFGRSNSGYATAAAQWRDLSNRGLVHRGDTNVPFGALAFSGGTDAAGHVMISIGGGRFITTAEQIKEVGLSYGGQYWGWSWANPEWPGR